MGKTLGPTRWTVPRQAYARSSRSLAVRVVGFLVVLFVVRQQHLYSIYTRALAAKYAPTDFGNPDFEKNYVLDDRAALLQEELVANRNGWKKLGAGWEGTTYTYNDVVIKTFTPGRSPFRNCAQRNTSLRWPTEIPASTLLGNGGDGRDVLTTSNDTTPGRFLPVKTAFFAATSSDAGPEWHLVTPFARHGTLKTLSSKVRQQDLDVRTLDSRYREKFHDLLRSLQVLHEAGYCHDDIKIDNVFVGDSDEWILGDLGNVRELNHPYHASRIWLDNDQLRDCRSNDVIRALKSYLSFLRGSLADTQGLDDDLFSRRDSLSKLFWSAMDDARDTNAEELQRRSRIYHAERTAGETKTRDERSLRQSSFLPKLSVKTVRASKAVDGMLHIGNSETYARWMAVTRIFGIQQEVCP